MINSNAYNFINVLEATADNSWKRNTLLTNNIANATTPNYKRKDISFNSYLLAELESTTGTLGQKVAGVDFNALQGYVYTDMSELSYRLDGNNVDIDTENAELASNQIVYQTLIESMNHEFNMLKAALKTT